MKNDLTIPLIPLAVTNTAVAFKVSKFSTLDMPLSGNQLMRFDFHSIWWIKSGNIHIESAGEYTLTAGSIVSINAKQALKLSISSPSEGVFIGFNDTFVCLNTETSTALDLYVNNDVPIRPLLHIKPEAEQTLEAYTQLLFAQFEKTDTYREKALHNLLDLFIIELNRLGEQENIQQLSTLNSNPHYTQLRHLVEENYKSLKSVSDYAETMNIAPACLNEFVKEATGITAGEFIRNRIILEAKRLLQHTNSSAKEIAFELGFDDQHYFSRFFKKYTGKTIAEFRKNTNTPS